MTRVSAIWLTLSVRSAAAVARADDGVAHITTLAKGSLYYGHDITSLAMIGSENQVILPPIDDAHRNAL